MSSRPPRAWRRALEGEPPDAGELERAAPGGIGCQVPEARRDRRGGRRRDGRSGRGRGRAARRDTCQRRHRPPAESRLVRSHGSGRRAVCPGPVFVLSSSSAGMVAASEARGSSTRRLDCVRERLTLRLPARTIAGQREQVLTTRPAAQPAAAGANLDRPAAQGGVDHPNERRKRLTDRVLWCCWPRWRSGFSDVPEWTMA